MKSYLSQSLVPPSLTLFMILGFFVAAAYADDEIERVHALKGKWKFSLGDDMAWSKPSFDDKAWEALRVGRDWEYQGYEGYNSFAWYRKTITLKKKDIPTDKNLYLFLGYIDDADQVYFNGKLVGSRGRFPPNYQTAHNVHRKYQIPRTLINVNKKNTIAVRVFDQGGPGGIKGGRSGIGIFAVKNSFIEKLDISGVWKFRTGDDMAWKESRYDDRKWKNINVPGLWEHQGYDNYDGFAWYRKKVFISKEYAKEKLVLSLGKIDDNDEVYLNGILVGRTGSMRGGHNTGHEWKDHRGYYLDSEVIKFGAENTIAIRVEDKQGDGGIYQGPLGIVTQKVYTSMWKRKRSLVEQWNERFGYHLLEDL